MGELIHFSRNPGDRKPQKSAEVVEIPTDFMDNDRAERRRKHFRVISAPINEAPKPLSVKDTEGFRPSSDLVEVPNTYVIPGSRQANLGAEAAKAAAASTDGRFGLGKVKVDMPADPSKVPGWDGDARR